MTLNGLDDKIFLHNYQQCHKIVIGASRQLFPTATGPRSRS